MVLVCRRSAVVALLGLFAASSVAPAAVVLSAVPSPAGAVAINDIVTVTLIIAGWSAADGEVDAVDFNVDFDTSLFDFVSLSGSALADGTEWLAQSNQQGDYSLLDDTNDAGVAFGRWGFGAFDDGTNAADGGTVAASGSLGSLQLKAKSAGVADSTTILITAPGADLFDVSGLGDTGQIFTNKAGSTVTPSSGVTISTVPEPSAFLALGVVALGLLGLKQGQRCRQRIMGR